VLPGRRGAAFYSMLTLPLSDPDAALRQIETFGARKYVTGFMITCVRQLGRASQRAHEDLPRPWRNAALGARLPFRHQSGRAGCSRISNRFASVHALGFPFYHILPHDQLDHQRAFRAFPKNCRSSGSKAGLAWVPFLMAAPSINEYMLRSSEYPLLKKEAERLHARDVLRLPADGGR